MLNISFVSRLRLYRIRSGAECDATTLNAASCVTALYVQVVDVTIAYPQGRPLDLQAIIAGWRPPCTTHVHYRYTALPILTRPSHLKLSFIWKTSFRDPDPQDPHVFGPPGSESIKQRYGSSDPSLSS
jgi:hypothetical protein